MSSGIGTRTTLPSETGEKPRFALWIAFSISEMALRSNGWIVMSRASGAFSCASFLIGVGVP